MKEEKELEADPEAVERKAWRPSRGVLRKTENGNDRGGETKTEETTDTHEKRETILREGKYRRG